MSEIVPAWEVLENTIDRQERKQQMDKQRTEIVTAFAKNKKLKKYELRDRHCEYELIEEFINKGYDVIQEVRTWRNRDLTAEPSRETRYYFSCENAEKDKRGTLSSTNV